MATVFNRASLEFSATLKLNEVEVRALDAIVGYGDDAFLKAFKEKLGEAYIRDHERGLRSAFKAIREQVLPALYELQQAHRDLIDAARKRQEYAEARAKAALPNFRDEAAEPDEPPTSPIRPRVSGLRWFKPWTWGLGFYEVKR